MPLIINDHKWRQTETKITLHVPLHGIPKNKVNLFTSQEYLKATFEQFFFEVFLLNSINVEGSKCTVGENAIVYELQKSVHEKWEELEKKLSREEKKEIRKKAFELESEKEKKNVDSRQIKKDELKRCAVGEAVHIESLQRKQIEQIREKEKLEALGDLKKWNKETEKKVKNEKKIYKTSTRSVPPPRIIKPETNIPIPLPRTNCVVNVEFTPRALPTPKRESQETEENEWLEKQAAARRSVGFVSEDLRPEEKNPQYLLGKGDEFLKNNNLLGAISAYTFGIQLSPNFVDLYIKRSEAHLALGNYNKCINDTSTALDLMKPAVEANLENRAVCIGRRGIALYHAEMIRQAVDELKASLTLKPMKIYAEFLDKIIEETRLKK